jgi:tetrapyrrole methylase family protein / MazG family protein
VSTGAAPATPRVVVCGLGPATAGLLTVDTRLAIDRVPHRFLRTHRHPSAPAVPDAVAFDDVYERADDFDEVYSTIVEQLVKAAVEHGEVLYAVPGSPLVAESTVERLRADDRVEVEILPAMSFLDLAWARLAVDPVEAGVRLVDGHRFDVEAAGERGPLLVTQCDTVDILSDVKLALDALPQVPPPVTVLQRLGLDDEMVATVAHTDLDRTVAPDHLTSLYVPVLASPVAGELGHLDQVIRRLRVECPWDREQTHASLRRHLLEEAYEVLEAIDHLDVEGGEGYGELEEELGDLLIQIFFHATLAAEQGQFELADVARVVREKMVGRHPHVFGTATAETADDVEARWDQIKQGEKGRESVMDGIPAALPALLYALKVQKRSATAGVEWRTLADENDVEVRGGPAGGENTGGQLGMALMDLVEQAGQAGIDPETELRLAAERVRDRFRAWEKDGRQTGQTGEI